jgi:hypothetical protein
MLEFSKEVQLSIEPANYVSKDVREKMLHEICLPKRG